MSRLSLVLTTAHSGFLVIFGFGLFPIFYRLFGFNGSIPGFAAFYVCALIGLRFGPGVFRRFIRFSTEVQEIWMKQRILGKRHDSYQWRKQFWIGLGMMLNHWYSGSSQGFQPAVASICMVVGALGLMAWRYRRSKLLPAQS